MTTMRAALDERFSDPGTQALPWADVEDVLTSAELFWVTTVRADDSPHQTPLVAVWLDGCLHFSTGSGEQKVYNLARNDQVLLTTGCNTWDRGVDVVVEGRAERVDDRVLLERLVTAWADKWDGRWQYEVDGEGFRHTAGGTAWVYRVKPPRCSPSQKARSPTRATSQPKPDNDRTTRNRRGRGEQRPAARCAGHVVRWDTTRSSAEVPLLTKLPSPRGPVNADAAALEISVSRDVAVGVDAFVQDHLYRHRAKLLPRPDPAATRSTAHRSATPGRGRSATLSPTSPTGAMSNTSMSSSLRRSNPPS